MLFAYTTEKHEMLLLQDKFEIQTTTFMWKKKVKNESESESTAKLFGPILFEKHYMCLIYNS
jgi:hypothetical protein